MLAYYKEISQKTSFDIKMSYMLKDEQDIKCDHKLLRNKQETDTNKCLLMHFLSRSLSNGK